jgi:hypothetical protein
MDKPELLKSILNNHPDASIELIQKLAQEEIDRQIKESIDGMLYKKYIGILRQITEYVVAPVIIVPDIHGDILDQDNILSNAVGHTNKILRKKRK